MYAPSLRGALWSYLEEAATTLSNERAAGAEVSFDVVPGNAKDRGATPFYCYRPLTTDFIRERASALTQLPSCAPALEALCGVEGLERWLRTCGRAPERARHAQARMALELLFEELFADTTDFALDRRAFDRVLDTLESAAGAEADRTIDLIAEVHGLALESDLVVMSEELTLARARAVADPPARLSELDDGDTRVLAHWSIRNRPGADGSTPSAAARAARLLTPLRLYGDGEVCVDPLGWVRHDQEPWQPIDLSSAIVSSRAGIPVPAPAEDELRAFVNLIGRRLPRGGAIAWALRRFELGCERSSAAEALSDYTLALRALLEPEGSASGYLQYRLALLCAVPEEREALSARVIAAIETERAVIGGLAPPQTAIDDAAAELAGHLRALLRDVLCGHLDADLRAVADNIVAQELAAAGTEAQPPEPEPEAESQPGFQFTY